MKVGVIFFHNNIEKIYQKKWIDKCNVVEKMLNYIQSEQYNKIENGTKL